MKYIKAPDIYVPEKGDLSVFLAGGISGCSNWQDEIVEKLKAKIYFNLVLINPRRDNFPIDDPNASYDQILWEHVHLRRASAVSFWFPKETLCPITLYELGTWSMSKKHLFIGVHPEYKRKADVDIQTRLVRPRINVVYSLEDLKEQIKNWYNKATEIANGRKIWS